MFKRFCLIALSAAALTTLSACVVAPPRANLYVHDRDHDGVPNRYDRDRNRDRDGDSAPNRYDRRPDNPYRR